MVRGVRMSKEGDDGLEADLGINCIIAEIISKDEFTQDNVPKPEALGI